MLIHLVLVGRHPKLGNNFVSRLLLSQNGIRAENHSEQEIVQPLEWVCLANISYVALSPVILWSLFTFSV